MEYKVKNMPSYIFCGFGTRAENSPEGFTRIHNLWEFALTPGKLDAITGAASENIVSIYSNSGGNYMGPYDITVTREVHNDTASQPEGTVFLRVPAQRYAEFKSERGDADGTYELWKRISHMPIPRAFTYDLEIHYITGEVTILVSLKE